MADGLERSPRKGLREREIQSGGRGSNPRRAPLVRHETIAEGVEDAETLTLLGDYGVDFAQGFYLGRPAPCAHRVTCAPATRLSAPQETRLETESATAAANPSTWSSVATKEGEK
jgi:hypothetical protein